MSRPPARPSAATPATARIPSFFSNRPFEPDDWSFLLWVATVPSRLEYVDQGYPEPSGGNGWFTRQHRPRRAPRHSLHRRPRKVERVRIGVARPLDVL